MKKVTTLLFAGLCVAGSVVQAQEAATFYKFTDIPVPLNAISDNGEWVGGSFQGNVFIQNTLTHNTENLTEEGNSFDVISGVSNDGTFVGTHGSTMGSAGAAYLKNGEWFLLETLNDYIAGGGMAITADSKIIAGCIAGEMGSDSPVMPVIWRLQNDGNYKIEALPYPEKDIFGMISQGSVAQEILSNGSIIVGRFTDYTGYYEQPIKWTLGSDNKYTYELIGDHILYNLNEKNPGTAILYDDYVTAPEGTPEFQEQYNKWKKDKKERDDLMANFMTDMYFGRSFKSNTDGTRILCTVQKEVLQDPEDPYSGYDLNSPYCFNLTNGTEFDCPFNANACAVTNSGKIIYATPFGGMTNVAYIMDENGTEGTPLNEWLKNEYNLDVDKELTIESTAGPKVVTGNVILNKTENAFISSYWVSDEMYFDNYIVKLPKPISPSSIQTNENSNIQVLSNGKSIKVTGEVMSIEATDISGKSVYLVKKQNDVCLDFLPSGIYIIKVLTENGQVIIKKIALK